MFWAALNVGLKVNVSGCPSREMAAPAITWKNWRRPYSCSALVGIFGSWLIRYCCISLERSVVLGVSAAVGLGPQVITVFSVLAWLLERSVVLGVSAAVGLGPQVITVPVRCWLGCWNVGEKYARSVRTGVHRIVRCVYRIRKIDFTFESGMATARHSMQL
jgi:hypothetical protein